MLPTTTVDGRLVADPELKFTGSGKAVCNVRVAASDSRKDDQGNWQTAEQIFLNVTLWEADGEAAADALQKGDRVLVTGRIYNREYEKSDGTKGYSLEVKFPTVGKVIHAKRADRSQQPPQRQAPANDPWATAPASNEDPPF